MKYQKKCPSSTCCCLLLGQLADCIKLFILFFVPSILFTESICLHLFLHMLDSAQYQGMDTVGDFRLFSSWWISSVFKSYLCAKLYCKGKKHHNSTIRRYLMNYQTDLNLKENLNQYTGYQKLKIANTTEHGGFLMSPQLHQYNGGFRHKGIEESLLNLVFCSRDWLTRQKECHQIYPLNQLSEDSFCYGLEGAPFLMAFNLKSRLRVTISDVLHRALVHSYSEPH